MPYTVGVDIGSIRATVATRKLCDHTGGPATAMGAGEPVTAIPTALYLDDEGYLLFGESASQAAAADPERVITAFHERIGDGVPIIVGGESFTAESLSAAVVAWSVSRVVEERDEQPERIVVTHPGNWGAYRRNLLVTALETEGLDAAALVPVPVAVLDEHTHAGLVPDAGGITAVFDVGPHHITPALVRRSPSGIWELLACGDPAGAPLEAGGEPVHPDDLVARGLDEAWALARHASVDLRRLGNVILHGSAAAIPAAGDRIRTHLACQPVALPEPEATAARGAATMAAGEIARRAEPAVAAVETALLPRVGTEPDAEPVPDRPPRPPVRIAPPTITAAAKFPGTWKAQRPSPLAAVLVALVTVATMLMLRGDYAAADVRHAPEGVTAPAACSATAPHPARGGC